MRGRRRRAWCGHGVEHAQRAVRPRPPAGVAGSGRRRRGGGSRSSGAQRAGSPWAGKTTTLAARTAAATCAAPVSLLTTTSAPANTAAQRADGGQPGQVDDGDGHRRRHGRRTRAARPAHRSGPRAARCRPAGRRRRRTRRATSGCRDGRRRGGGRRRACPRAPGRRAARRLRPGATGRPDRSMSVPTGGAPAAVVTASTRWISCSSAGYGTTVPGGCQAPGCAAQTWERAPSIVVRTLVVTPLPCTWTARSKRRAAAAPKNRRARAASGVTSGSPGTPSTTSRSSTSVGNASRNHRADRSPTSVTWARGWAARQRGEPGYGAQQVAQPGQRPYDGDARRCHRCAVAAAVSTGEGSPAAGAAGSGRTRARGTFRHRIQPRARCHVAAGGMATLVAIIVATSLAVRGPGAMRRQARRVVRSAHRAGRQSRHPPAARRQRGQRRQPGAERHRVRPEGAGGNAEAVAPHPAVQPLEQHVVGVAALQAHADPPVGRTHPVAHVPLAQGQSPSAVEQAQRQVGVLPVGAGEALVEAADVFERRSSHAQVGRDPRRFLQPGDVALPVGGPAIGGQRHLDAPLHRGDVGLGEVDVGPQRAEPSERRLDVVVDEGDPRRRRRPPSDVARRGRPPSARGDDRDPGIVDAEIEGRCRVGPIVDHDHPSAGGQRPVQHPDQPGQRQPADGGDDDVDALGRPAR